MAQPGTDYTWQPSSSQLAEMQIGFPNGALSGPTKVTVLLERHGQSQEYRLIVDGDQALAASYFLSLPKVFKDYVTVDHVVSHSLHFTPMDQEGDETTTEGSELGPDRITLHTGGAVVLEHDRWGQLTRGHETFSAEPPIGDGAPPQLGWGGLGGSAFTVTNTNDSGAGSLRTAIIYANANAGHNTITFSIPGSGVRTIALSSALPTITDPVTLNGTSQPGFTAIPLIELDGTIAGASENGLTFAPGSGMSVVRSLIIRSFSGSGIDIASDDVSVLGCYIGTDSAGAFAMANRNGIYIHDVARATIGGTMPADRNIISGNLETGLMLGGFSASVLGNYFGLDASGTAALPNDDGIVFLPTSHDNRVGDTEFDRNTVSGNTSDGIIVDGTSNAVTGNYIGKNAAGTANILNGGQAIVINGTASTPNVTGNTVAP